MDGDQKEPTILVSIQLTHVALLRAAVRALELDNRQALCLLMTTVYIWAMNLGARAEDMIRLNELAAEAAAKLLATDGAAGVDAIRPPSNGTLN